MESRRSAQWTITRPLTRVILILIITSLFGIFAAPWVSRTLGPQTARIFSGFRPAVFRPSESSLLSDRDTLRQQLQSVTEKLLDAERRLETAEALDKLENFTRDRRIDAVYGQVVAYSPDPGIQAVTINRGESDGVQTGLAAVSGEGFVIGVVRRVTSGTATILLVTDPQTRIVSKVRNELQSRGLTQGEQGLSIRMSFIPKHEPVEPGQLIVTSGADRSIPVDLPIGTVGQVGSQSGDLFQSISVVTPVDIQNLDVVAIIPSSQ